MSFKSFDELRAACAALPAGSEQAAAAARARQAILTKPQGSLGRLEEIAAWLAQWQGREMPQLEKVQVVIFAGSHGVGPDDPHGVPGEEDRSGDDDPHLEMGLPPPDVGVRSEDHDISLSPVFDVRPCEDVDQCVTPVTGSPSPCFESPAV